MYETSSEEHPIFWLSDIQFIRFIPGMNFGSYYLRNGKPRLIQFIARLVPLKARGSAMYCFLQQRKRNVYRRNEVCDVIYNKYFLKAVYIHRYSTLCLFP
jgi:hypothetical protein